MKKLFFSPTRSIFDLDQFLIWIYIWYSKYLIIQSRWIHDIVSLYIHIMVSNFVRSDLTLIFELIWVVSKYHKENFNWLQYTFWKFLKAYYWNKYPYCLQFCTKIQTQIMNITIWISLICQCQTQPKTQLSWTEFSFNLDFPHPSPPPGK